MQDNHTLVKQFMDSVKKGGALPFQLTKNKDGVFLPVSYSEAWEQILSLAAGLMEYNVCRDDHVGIISDNRQEWSIIDHALLCLGAADVPRGSDSTDTEVAFILSHAECRLVFLENLSQLEKLRPFYGTISCVSTIVLIDDTGFDRASPCPFTVLSYRDLMRQGSVRLPQVREQIMAEIERGRADDIATIIYTSGTTGQPKGVVLSHRSFLFQVEQLQTYLYLKPGEILLSVLPIWHSLERAVFYFVIQKTATVAYSKLVSKILLEDFLKVQPHWFTSVPRIWESIRAGVIKKVAAGSPLKKALFNFFLSVGTLHAGLVAQFLWRVPAFTMRIRLLDSLAALIPMMLLTPLRALGSVLVFSQIRARLGKRFVAGVSGGGALPPHVDTFFMTAGVKLLEGYGLTETGPILAVRKQRHPVLGTIGPLFPDVEFKVIDDKGRNVGPNHKGVLWVKSPQIMLGYYKRPEETAAVLQDGWLNTGDLVIRTHGREFRIVGRTKETIVLMGGENVEPVPIEETILQSDYIDQVMVVGQDQKYLGALVVPNTEKMEDFAKQAGIFYSDIIELYDRAEFQEFLNREIQTMVSVKTGFKIFERIYRIAVLKERFEVGAEMTQSLKLKRNVISDKYHKIIASLFAE